MEATEANIGATRRLLTRVFGVVYLLTMAGWVYLYSGLLWQALSKGSLRGALGVGALVLAWLIPGCIEVLLGVRAIRGDLRAVFRALILMVLPGVPLLMLSALFMVNAGTPSAVFWWLKGGFILQAGLLAGGSALCFSWPGDLGDVPAPPAGTEPAAEE
ncbi:MAG: hypothetical protein KDB82_13540 [Planctomycetes bacterium]|nr:hypothetical protein [Planctomycetota bacterium]